jgi:hypothetical protein
MRAFCVVSVAGFFADGNCIMSVFIMRATQWTSQNNKENQAIGSL